MTAENRQSRFLRMVVGQPLLLLSFIFIVGFAAVLWQATHLATSLVESSALSSASRYSKVLAELRSLYTSEVVDRVQGHAVEITHDYHDKEGAIPLPATLSMLLGEKIGLRGEGMEVHLYSPHPFPWRRDTGGLADDFREKAWRHLRAEPGLPFYRFEQYRNRSSLRYATADLMRDQCVNCHNTHPDTPKSNWRAGDVRGVLEVIIPLDAVREDSRSGLWATIALLVGMGLVSLACLAVAIGQMKRGAQRLEEEVTSRTADLRQQIAEREEAESGMRQSEAHKSAVLDSALDCVISMDQHGRITEFNPAAERTFGYRREQVIGELLSDKIVPPGFRAKHMQGLAHYLETGEGPVLDQRIEISGMHADGTEFPVELVITPIDVGGPPSFTAHIRDITERIQAEDGLRHAVEQSEAANKAKSRFLANMSHEIRTPLNAIMGFTEILATRIEDATLKKYLASIRASGKSLITLIDDVLDLSRVGAGKLEMHPRPTDVCALLHEIELVYAPKASGKDCDLNWKSIPGCPMRW